MKCKKCGYRISENDTICPGCDTSVEKLKQDGHIMYDNNLYEFENDNIEVTQSVPVIEEKTIEPVIKGKKQKNKKMNFVVLLILILALIIVSLSILFSYTSPAMIMERSLINIISKLPKDVPNIAKLNMETTYQTNNTAEDNFINNIKLNSEVNYDLSTLKFNNNLVVTDTLENEKITDAVIIKNANKVYIADINLYNPIVGDELLSDAEAVTYIETDGKPLSSYEYTKQLNYIIYQGEFKKIFREIERMVPALFKTKHYKKEYTTTTYNEKNMGTTKVTYNVSDDAASKVFQTFITNIKKNNGMISSLMKIWNMDKDGVIAKLDEYDKIFAKGNTNFEVNLYADFITTTLYSLDLTISGPSYNYNLVLDLEADGTIKSIKYLDNGKTTYISDDFKKIVVSKMTNDNTKIEMTYIYNISDSNSFELPVITNSVNYIDAIANIKANIESNEKIYKTYTALIGDTNDIILDAIVEE